MPRHAGHSMSLFLSSNFLWNFLFPLWPLLSLTSFWHIFLYPYPKDILLIAVPKFTCMTSKLAADDISWSISFLWATNLTRFVWPHEASPHGYVDMKICSIIDFFSQCSHHVFMWFISSLNCIVSQKYDAPLLPLMCMKWNSAQYRVRSYLATIVNYIPNKYI